MGAGEALLRALALLALSGFCSAATLPNEQKNYVQSVRIVSATASPAPGSLPSEQSTYILDVNAFGLILSTSVAYLNQPNTFTSSQTFNNRVYISSNLVVIGSVTASAFFGDGSHLSGIASATVGITSSCAAGYYLSTGTWVNGVTTGGGCMLAGSGGGMTNTSLSSFTVYGNFLSTGNITISTGSGITAGTSSSTMTPCGPLFFISSQTVSGSTSTAGTSNTYFSTWTYSGGQLVSPGDELVIECIFDHTAMPPSTAHHSIYLEKNGTLIADSSAQNSDGGVKVTSYFTLATLTTVSDYGYCSMAISNTTSQCDNGYIRSLAFDPTSSHTFYCSANRQIVGTIGFVSMRVSKACQ